MMRDDDFDDDDSDDLPPPRRRAPEPPHSGFGIASFFIALAVGLGEFVLVVIAGVLTVRNNGPLDDQSPAAIGLGLLICGGLVAAVFGVILGAGGLVQANRKRIFPVVGLTLNVLLILVIGALFLLGVLAQ